LLTKTDYTQAQTDISEYTISHTLGGLLIKVGVYYVNVCYDSRLARLKTVLTAAD